MDADIKEELLNIVRPSAWNPDHPLSPDNSDTGPLDSILDSPPVCSYMFTRDVSTVQDDSRLDLETANRRSTSSEDRVVSTYSQSDPGGYGPTAFTNSDRARRAIAHGAAQSWMRIRRSIGRPSDEELEPNLLGVTVNPERVSDLFTPSPSRATTLPASTQVAAIASMIPPLPTPLPFVLPSRGPAMQSSNQSVDVVRIDTPRQIDVSSPPDNQAQGLPGHIGKGAHSGKGSENGQTPSRNAWSVQ